MLESRRLSVSFTRHRRFSPLCGVTSTPTPHPDTSYSRIAITSRESNVNSASICDPTAIHPLDANNDGTLSRSELETAYPKLVTFLRQRLSGLESTRIGIRRCRPAHLACRTREKEFQIRLRPAIINFTFRNPMLGAPEDVTLTSIL